MPHRHKLRNEQRDRPQNNCEDSYAQTPYRSGSSRAFGLSSQESVSLPHMLPVSFQQTERVEVPAASLAGRVVLHNEQAPDSTPYSLDDFSMSIEVRLALARVLSLPILASGSE